MKYLLALCLAALVLIVATSAMALERSPNGFFHTGDGVRSKSILFVNIKIYAIRHDMRELPPTKSKQAVIDMETDKLISWRMLRNAPGDKIHSILGEAFAMNGYRDQVKIGQFLSAFKGDLKENQSVIISYDAAQKVTTITVAGMGSASVRGVDFMKATWSIWFGKSEQAELGDALISRL